MSKSSSFWNLVLPWIQGMGINPLTLMLFVSLQRSIIFFDFTENEKITLRYQLHFRIDFLHDPNLKRLSFIKKLCQYLMEMKKSRIYSLINILIRLVLTLSIFIATTERTFSAMKFLKTRLHNKMEDEFFVDRLVI